MKRIAILGSTGSIGSQAVDIILSNPQLFRASVLVARNNYKLLIEQALELNPQLVVIANEEHYPIVKSALAHLPIEIASGIAAITQAATLTEVDIVLTAMVGYAGLEPTIAAIRAKKDIALANKETLVVAGELITTLSREYQTRIFPVDSEHSAIYQCLLGESQAPEKILLTASGGPFLNHHLEELHKVTPQQALCHPNWNMGAKVSIDSASMMNKGFEMIEAHWLFNIPTNQIEVLIHPESIIHSMIQFPDGSIKAQLGIPDMRLPISYALGTNYRVKNNYPRVDFFAQDLTFRKPDFKRYPNLRLAYEAIQRKGSTPCVLNAANEIAVDAFLKGIIGFCSINHILEQVLDSHQTIEHPDLSSIVTIDKDTRHLTKGLIKRI